MGISAAESTRPAGYDSTAPARTGRNPDFILIAGQQSKSPDSTYPEKEQ